ncbi:MAG: hypothetical protein AB1578_01940 [Thermodesulfobacteriota bacterium]
MSFKFLWILAASLVLAASAASAHPWSGSPAPGKPGVHAHLSAARAKALAAQAGVPEVRERGPRSGVHEAVRRVIPLPKRHL